MNQYNCLIIDDEDLARSLLESYVEKIPQLNLLGSCASAIEATPILHEKQVDLLLLDIEMPVLKGMDFYRNLTNKPKVIFTTAYRDYAVEGFEQSAVDYLLKPITFPRFYKAIERFISIVNLESASNYSPEEHIFIRENRKEIKLIINEVLYIQSLKDYIQIYTNDNKHIVKSSLTGFIEQLPAHFKRVHRSYAINTLQITAITNKDIEIGEHEIPIGDNFRHFLAEFRQ